MADSTTKSPSNLSQENVLRGAYNEMNATISVDSFIVGKVGHKLTRTVVSPTVDDYSFFDGTTLLYTLRVTYDNVAHDNVDQVERIA